MTKLANGQTIEIRGGRVIDPASQFDESASVFIADGKIAGIGQTPAGFKADQVIDAQGLVVAPGLVDLSARIAGNIDAELAAAVAGGVTTLACPPDVDPILDEPELAERLVRHAEDVSQVRVLPVGAMTQGLAGHMLAEMSLLRDAGCIAVSQGQGLPSDTRVLWRALQYAASCDVPVWLQPAEFHLSKEGIAHDSALASRLGLSAIPVAAETLAMQTVLALAKATGARVHFTQVSSAEGVALLREARDAGLPVTGDVAVHALHLYEQDIGYFDPLTRFDPPLRGYGDREALRLGLAEGTIGAAVSAHTPLGLDVKRVPFAEAAPGATGIELLLPLTLAWGEALSLPLRRSLLPVTSQAAAILGIEAGQVAVGHRADLCIFDPEASWTVREEDLRSAGKLTPFLGRTLQGRVVTTLAGGQPVYRRS
jgi:dihydroorotase